MAGYNNTEFNDLVIKHVGRLSSKQLARFAWLCGIRALPFMYVDKSLKLEAGKTQEFLNTVFYALDVCALFFCKDDASTHIGVNSRVSAARAASDAFHAIRATHTANNTRTVTTEVIAAAAFAVCVVAELSGTNPPSYYAANTAVRTSNAASAARITLANVQNIILSDIEAISKNKQSFHHITDIYGPIWQDFLNALHAEGCSYWANLYSDLFNNGFKIDVDELSRRLRVPEAKRAEGAAAVGKYLENTIDIKAKNLNESRIIILGDMGAGKTSLAKRLIDIDADMPGRDESTIGVITTTWRLPGQDGKDPTDVHIWDFAGHAITHSAHRLFMSSRCLYIYVYDGRKEQRNDPRYWLEQIEAYAGKNAEVLFLITVHDGLVFITNQA